MIPVDYCGLRLYVDREAVALAVAPLLLFMAGGGRVSILEACATAPTGQGVTL